ncbi:MAG: EpsG family protein [Dolichospermum sp.]
MTLITNLNEQTQGVSLHQIFANLYKFKYIILTTALILWSIIPILGIVFLLIYCQINISGNKIKDGNIIIANLIPLILVVFTVTIYNATITTFSDTDVYIKVYKLLFYEPLFHTTYAYDTDKEPISFILPQLLSKLTSGDEFSFLLLQSATINIALTVYSIIFIPEFYPIVTLINVMSNGYYYQLFWMPQFYSFIFIIPSIYLSNYIKSIFLIGIAFFTHNSSLVILGTIFIEKIRDFISQILKMMNLTTIYTKYLFLPFMFGLLLFISGEIVKNISEIALGNNLFSEKITAYTGDSVSSFNQEHFSIRNQIRSLLDYSVILIFVFKSKSNKFNSFIFFRWVAVLLIMLVFYLSAYTFGFNMRASALFFCLPGFFYTIPIYSGKLNGHVNIYTYIVLISIILRIVYFTLSLLHGPNYLNFFDGNELTTPITGYFQVLWK